MWAALDGDEADDGAATTERTGSVQSSVASSLMPLTAMARRKYGDFESKKKGVPLVSKSAVDADSFAAVGGVPEHVAALRRELQRGDDSLIVHGIAPPPAPPATVRTKATAGSARRAASAKSRGAPASQHGKAPGAAPQPEKPPVLNGLDAAEEARRQRIAYRMQFFNDPRVVAQLEEAAAKKNKASSRGLTARSASGITRSSSTVTAKSKAGGDDDSGVRLNRAAQLRRGASFAKSSTAGDDAENGVGTSGRRDTFLRSTSVASNKHQRRAASRDRSASRGGREDDRSVEAASVVQTDDGAARPTGVRTAAPSASPQHRSQPRRAVVASDDAPTTYEACVAANLAATAAWCAQQA